MAVVVLSAAERETGHGVEQDLVRRHTVVFLFELSIRKLADFGWRRFAEFSGFW